MLVHTYLQLPAPRVSLEQMQTEPGIHAALRYCGCWINAFWLSGLVYGRTTRFSLIQEVHGLPANNPFDARLAKIPLVMLSS